jgi:hypothetical protein
VIPVVIVIDAADIKNRDRFQFSTAVELQAAFVGAPDCVWIAGHAIGDVVEILVVATDVRVQVQKLRFGDRSAVQRLQAVLHSDVVEGAQGKTIGRFTP